MKIMAVLAVLLATTVSVGTAAQTDLTIDYGGGLGTAFAIGSEFTIGILPVLR